MKQQNVLIILNFEFFLLFFESLLTVSLLKGVRDITQHDRTLKEGHDDQIRFSVQNSKPGDTGTYCVVARNQHGTDRAFVTITVKSPKKKD